MIGAASILGGAHTGCFLVNIWIFENVPLLILPKFIYYM